MIYTEQDMDLFSVMSNYYYLAHCISADFALGEGIAVQFDKYFNMKNILKIHHPNYLELYEKFGAKGDCILEGRILYLVTKGRYYQNPTMKSMEAALNKMKKICISKKIKKFAMPTIGSGLDCLNWYDVSTLIKAIFKNTDIEILVCKWR